MESITKYFDPKIDPWYRKGEQEGEQKGELKGELKAVEKMAFKLLAKGQTLAFVSDVTGLSVEQLRQLSQKPPR